MDDEAYVRALFEILTRPADDDPQGSGDGVDRHDGFGSELRVTDASVVQGPYGTEVELVFTWDVPDEPRLAHVPPGSVRVPLDAEWRRLSEYDEPADYAPAVARHVERAARRHLATHLPEHFGRRVPALPGRDEQWRLLLHGLAREGTLREVAPGRVDVALRDGDVVTVLVGADEWELVLREQGLPDDLTFMDLLGPRDPEERYVVAWDGELVRSIRAELPPVRGGAELRALTRRIVAHREAHPDAEMGWYAFRPDGTAERFGADDELPG